MKHRINVKKKGNSFERLIANMCKPFFPDARRGNQTRDGGKESPDVILSYNNDVCFIECKRLKKEPYPGIYKVWLKKAKSDRDIWCKRMGYTKLPVFLIYKYNNEPIKVKSEENEDLPLRVFLTFLNMVGKFYVNKNSLSTL